MKGSRVSLFKVGDLVSFTTKKVTYTGRISKLHKAGRQGIAEIYPYDEIPITRMKKVSRKLQNVWKPRKV